MRPARLSFVLLIVDKKAILANMSNIMPTTPVIAPDDQRRLARLAERIRTARKRQRVTTISAAQAAGISRFTLHRIERGEPTVAVGAWVAVATALGLTLDLMDAKARVSTTKLPKKIRLRDFPQLKKLAWQLHGVEEISPLEALDLYERNWRHLDRAAVSADEAVLIDALSRELSGGRLLV
jgi:transcriptional regulator with XRE-family HTH domain